MSSSDKIISNAFGTLGAVCWSVQLLPQIWLNYRRHAAPGLSPSFMLCWVCAGVFLGVYNVVQNFNIALKIQPQILTGLSLFTWAQCHYYERGWKLHTAAVVASIVAGLMGALEAGLVFAVRYGIDHGTVWPVTLMAVLAAFFLALGVLEQYLAIWKTKSVDGISFLFCGIDAMGDVTSIVSVCFEPKLEVLGLVMYAVELLLWVGIFACGAYLKFAPWVRKQISMLRRRRENETIPSAVTLHDMPSSTSVFYTPEGSVEIRSRRRHEAA